MAVPDQVKKGPPKKAYAVILSEIELPPGLAIWVVTVHLLTLLSPLVLVWQINQHWDFVQAHAYNAALLYVAIALMMASSAFEIAQNAFDRWYLTGDTASALMSSFSDFLFYVFLVAGLVTIVIACQGDVIWAVVGIVAAVAFTTLYLLGLSPYPALSVLGLTATTALYFSFGDPVVFLQLVCSGLTLFFFDLLLKTGAQVLHGFTTGSNALGVLMIVWAISNGATDQTKSWVFVLAVAAATGLVAFLMRPTLSKLTTTPRIKR